MNFCILGDVCDMHSTSGEVEREGFRVKHGMTEHFVILNFSLHHFRHTFSEVWRILGVVCDMHSTSGEVEREGFRVKHGMTRHARNDETRME